MSTENKLNPFQKLFEITKEYMSGFRNKNDLVRDTISADNIREFITLFNRFELLEKTSGGKYKFKDEIFDKNIFNEKSYNAFTIASIISRNRKATKSVIKYLFKDSVSNTRNQMIYKYDKFYNEKLIYYIDDQKYLRIIYQVNYNKSNSTKLSMEFQINSEYIRLVILEVFIDEDTWYIVAYNTNNKKIEIYDQQHILNFDDISWDTQIEYIGPKTIEDEITNFLEDKSSLKKGGEIFYVKASLGVINKLLSWELIDDCEIYYENDNLKNLDADQLANIAKQLKRKKIDNNKLHISKYVSYSMYTESKEVDYSDNLNYYSKLNRFWEQEDYVFELKTNSLKKDFIKLNFRNKISIINKSSIEII